ncbi:uncharacterized protein LOC111396554 [Olea europaea var. sylvestris]|uniref:uncharacterized protein LOC111396554 n=1 Tax=Olea europaea var. sylvestris TaxID=158386 RepID=UPI000C1CE5F3|nr:uncharacterized protein LOC111396554 [Olea europaea var. sylvestris]
MPKKRSSLLLKFSIFLAKMREPIIPTFISLKKTRKFKLPNHYNYRYIKAYEFSPSDTPLIQFHRKSKKRKILKNFSSIIFISKCLGMLTAAEEEGRYPLGIEIETLPCHRDSVARELSLIPDSCSEDDSVDERAEKFIQKFYEEMRRQRQESLMQAA